MAFFFGGAVAPEGSKNFGYLCFGLVGVGGDNGGLIVLAVKDEC